MAVAELGCSYASLILHDDGIPITAEKISTLLEASNVNVDSCWPRLFAKLAAKRSLGDLISSAGAVGCANPAAFTTAPAAAVVEKKEESKEESDDDDMEYDDGYFGSILFD